MMKALFIGQTYIDVTFVADRIPVGDEKTVAKDYAVSFGGNAVTAAFCCARLGIAPDLLTSLADDWLGRMFLDMAAKYGISVHGRKVKESSISFVMPQNGKRAIIRCRDDHYLHPVPPLNLGEHCGALHLDGHQPDAGLQYARECKEAGILVSLDGGTVRSNTLELLEFVDVPVVSELFCTQMKLSPHDMCRLLIDKGARAGGVTLGSEGLIWFDDAQDVAHMPALKIPPESIIDTNGAGDIFHGAYVYSYLAAPEKSWEEHFQFARAASTHAIQFMGNEASLPSLADVDIIQRTYMTLS